MDTKYCPKCSRNLPLGSFGKDRSTKSGLGAYCRTCRIDLARARYWKNAEAMRELERHRSRKKRYGITEFEYRELLDQQGKVCAICGKSSELNRDGALHIDHNHETGKIRGLLCYQCNTGLGSFKDSINLLGQAIEYLRVERRS